MNYSKKNVLFLLIIIILLLFFYFYKKDYFLINKEDFLVSWTPYIVDNYYQPGYSNYFYNNGYMYPVF